MGTEWTLGERSRSHPHDHGSGDQAVPNNAYSGPRHNCSFNQKKAPRHYASAPRKDPEP